MSRLWNYKLFFKDLHTCWEKSNLIELGIYCFIRLNHCIIIWLKLHQFKNRIWTATEIGGTPPPPLHLKLYLKKNISNQGGKHSHYPWKKSGKRPEGPKTAPCSRALNTKDILNWFNTRVGPNLTLQNIILF